MILNPDRYSVTSNTRKNGVVVHDSEGGEGLLAPNITASAQLVAALRAKGDRPSPSRPGGFYGAGYSAVACEDGTYVVVADATAGPYHAPPCNTTWWSICIPGRAAQTRDQWLDGPSRQYVRAVARYIVDRQRDDGLTWPLQYRSASELVKANADQAKHPCGYTSHAQVAQAWHQTDHTDPGVSFPWDILAADIAALIEPAPSQEDEMPSQIHVKGDAATYNVDGLIATWSRNEAVQAAAVDGKLVSAGVREVKREALGILELHGAQPDYTNVDKAAFPVQTTGADFARHVA